MNRSVALSILAALIVILTVIIILPQLESNPENLRSQTICASDGSTYATTYHAGTMPICTVYSWQVLKTNVVISQQAACMALEAVGHTCPTADSSYQLTGVLLVEYSGTDYYVATLTQGPYNDGPYTPDQPITQTRVVWFSNTTVFCINPQYDKNGTGSP